MKVLRALLLLVFLLGSWPGGTAHALSMQVPQAGDTASDQGPPPCHSEQDNASAAGQQSDSAKAQECCKSGQCDCAHASPAAPAVLQSDDALIGQEDSPTLASRACALAAIDTPLRPPAA